ncbi:serine hydrolase [Streptomyces sp. NPDC049954]|uniref:serine hydrolase n=1 Tax=Streptomyces sp. NPDC049954 TaxID=3155779 RepID=UPI00341C3FA5
MEEVLTEAGLLASWHVRDVDAEAELGRGADAPVATASVHKLFLVTALFREAAAGRIDPTAPVELPVPGRSPGRTGLSVMRDAARLSLRDLASLAVAVSDNAAADVLWDHVGMDTVNRTVAELGLRRTVSAQRYGELAASVAEDAGEGGAAALLDPASPVRVRALDPASGNRSTARDTTALLAKVWRGEACAGPWGEELLRVLGLQTWQHRLASGFPFDDVRVSGKTGSLLSLRHEAGVVEYPDGRRYAVAFYTRALSPALAQPRADSAIGTAARLAVDALRG